MKEQLANEINDAVADALDAFEKVKSLLAHHDKHWFENWKAGGCLMGGFVSNYNQLEDYEADIDEESEEE